MDVSFAAAAMEQVDAATHDGWPDALVAALALDADAGAVELTAAAAVLGGVLAADGVSAGTRRTVAEQLVWTAMRCAAPSAPGALEDRVRAAREAVAEGRWVPGEDESPAEAMGELFALAADAAGTHTG